MMVYLISGSGQGSGKTTLARKLVAESAIFSIAGPMRRELKALYPGYDWFNKSQEYKENTPVTEYGGLPLRQVLIRYGEEQRKKDFRVWPRKLVAEMLVAPALSVAAIDDVRYLAELVLLKEAFPSAVHFHVHYYDAVKEACDTSELSEIADYICYRHIESAK